MKPLKINPDFKALIPPLSQDELSGLTQSILAHGKCRDTIKIWKGTIIDGHNRYAICHAYNIPYSTQNLIFASKKDAELWIVQNQLGRRNLVNAMRIKLALHMEALLQEKAKKNRNGNQDAPVHVRKTIAKEAGVSEQTVYRYMRIRELGTPTLIQEVEAGEKTIGKAYREANAGQTAGLEVTTRTVEVFAGSDEPSNVTDNPLCRRAVLHNIERIEKQINHLRENSALLKGLQDISRLHKKLVLQTKTIDAFKYAYR